MPRSLHSLAPRARRVALLRVTLITLMLLAVAAVAVACGGDDDGDDADQQLVARIAQLEADLGEAQASAAEAQDTADAAAAAAEGDASSAQADAAELEDRIADLEADLRDARAAVEAAAGEESATITIYSGRSESLVGPIIEQFEADSGINVRVRYGGTSELAAALLEEGDRSPADVFFAQDAGALGAIEAAGLFAALPASVLDAVAPGFRSTSNAWTGVSGRARVLVYSTERVAAGDLPGSIFDLTGPEWTDRVGWAPDQRLLPGVRHRHAPDRGRGAHGAVAARHDRERRQRVPQQLDAGAGRRRRRDRHRPRQPLLPVPLHEARTPATRPPTTTPTPAARAR